MIFWKQKLNGIIARRAVPGHGLCNWWIYPDRRETHGRACNITAHHISKYQRPNGQDWTSFLTLESALPCYPEWVLGTAAALVQHRVRSSSALRTSVLRRSQSQWLSGCRSRNYTKLFPELNPILQYPNPLNQTTNRSIGGLPDDDSIPVRRWVAERDFVQTIPLVCISSGTPIDSVPCDARIPNK